METPLLCKFVDFLAIRDANTPRRCDNLTAVGDKNWLTFHYATLLLLLLFYGFWVVAYILAHYSGRRWCTTAMRRYKCWLNDFFWRWGGMEGFILYSKKEEHLCKFDCVLTTYVFPFCVDSWYIHSSRNNALVVPFPLSAWKGPAAGPLIKVATSAKAASLQEQGRAELTSAFCWIAFSLFCLNF